jgi:hypothetical protein
MFTVPPAGSRDEQGNVNVPWWMEKDKNRYTDYREKQKTSSAMDELERFSAKLRTPDRNVLATGRFEPQTSPSYTFKEPTISLRSRKAVGGKEVLNFFPIFLT